MRGCLRYTAVNPAIPIAPGLALGRLANGRGLILRCLSKEESERLAQVATPAATATPAVGSSSQNSQATVATQPAAAAASPPQASANVAPASPPASGPPQSAVGAAVGGSPNPATADAFLAELVSIVADDGELPLAKKKLSAALERYAKCVADFGGLTAAVGQVEVRFLVRERGRAEGANAEKVHGMSDAAGACIAQVIDRRPTGVPAAPVVGATAIIRVRKKPTK